MPAYRLPPASSMTATIPLPSKTAKKLEARLRGLVGKAIHDYGMIEAGDRVMVCLSGGKDSYTMLSLLRSLQRSAPIDFELLAVNLDQKQPGFPAQVLPDYLSTLGVPYRIVEADTYSTVMRRDSRREDDVWPLLPTAPWHSLSSRSRRGCHQNCPGSPPGRHCGNPFPEYVSWGRLKAMPPKLRTDDGRHLVIRPLAYCPEADIARYARYRQFPIIPCNLCGSQENLQRTQIKQMLQAWEAQDPGRIDNLFRSLQNVSPSHLADAALFDFAGLTTAAFY
jgi:tRNA 2-thiocytidine biosynthesis protein TtcA